jgi:hypothetical protein
MIDCFIRSFRYPARGSVPWWSDMRDSTIPVFSKQVFYSSLYRMIVYNQQLSLPVPMPGFSYCFLLQLIAYNLPPSTIILQKWSHVKKCRQLNISCLSCLQFSLLYGKFYNFILLYYNNTRYFFVKLNLSKVTITISLF